MALVIWYAFLESSLFSKTANWSQMWQEMKVGSAITETKPIAGHSCAVAHFKMMAFSPLCFGRKELPKGKLCFRVWRNRCGHSQYSLEVHSAPAPSFSRTYTKSFSVVFFFLFFFSVVFKELLNSVLPVREQFHLFFFFSEVEVKHLHNLDAMLCAVRILSKAITSLERTDNDCCSLK